jgi:hypothetical protein
MKKVARLLAFIVILIACDKDQFETKPTLKLESLSSEFVQKNEDLQVKFSFTDKEGDVSDTLFVFRSRLNKRGIINHAVTPFRIPDFPNTTKGEIVLNLNYGKALTLNNSPALSIPGQSGKFEPDTMLLRFILKDKANNKSDTAIANVIVER